MIFTMTAVSAARLRSLAEQLHPVYRDCYAGPPWNETPDETAAFPARLIKDMNNPGAYGVVAFRGGRPVGVVYGWPTTAGDLPPEVSSPAVLVAGLMVARAWREQGLGRRLLSRFTAGHLRAWLTTHADTAAFYESAGWVRRAESDDGGVPRVLYLRETPMPRVSSTRSVCGVSRAALWAPPDRRPRGRPI